MTEIAARTKSPVVFEALSCCCPGGERTQPLAPASGSGVEVAKWSEGTGMIKLESMDR